MATLSSCSTQEHQPRRVSKLKLASRVKALLQRRTKTAGVKEQPDSRLFNLPAELRLKIWQSALTATESSKPAHFHIYDEVYDSCAYEKHSRENRDHESGRQCQRHDREAREARKLRRRRPRQMSLLLTCRAAYEEGIQYLYDGTEFTLVLLAGYARPDPRLDELHNLGKLQDCRALFSRMRRVTLVIQPGKRPNTDKYCARVTQLLEVLDFGARLEYLCLHFNFHTRMFLLPHGVRRLHHVFEALLPLKDPVAQNRKLTFELRRCAPKATRPDLLLYYFMNFRADMGAERMTSWTQRKKLGNRCLARGAYGELEVEKAYAAPLTPKQRKKENIEVGVFCAVYLVFLPVTIPLTAGLLMKRRKMKGES